MPMRPKPSARHPNADRPSSGRAGIRPTSRCGCPRRAGRSRPRPTVSCGPAGPRTSARPGWAPPYVVDELREAHLAEDTYRADAVRAWYRADAATDKAERVRAQQEAEESSALAQEVGAHREALAEVAEARRGWHAATELDRQRALIADTELRRRHPDAELPQLHPDRGTTPFRAGCRNRSG